MKLKHNVFEFKTNEKTETLNLNSKSNILLVIDGKETTIEIGNLFVKKAEIDEDDICGYSILQMLIGQKLKIDEQTTLEITFIDKVTDKKFFISKIRRPFMYDNDIEITIDKRIEYVNILLSGLNSVNSLSVNGTEPLPEAVVEPEPSTRPLGGDEFLEIKNKLHGLGFSEYITDENDNYHFFYKPSNEKTEIAFYELIPGGCNDVDLFEEEIGVAEESYSFVDTFGNDKLIIYDVKKNKITIKETVNS